MLTGVPLFASDRTDVRLAAHVLVRGALDILRCARAQDNLTSNTTKLELLNWLSCDADRHVPTPSLMLN